MWLAKLMCSLFAAFSLLIASVYSFPNGAPADTCVKKRPNQPNHGQARSQPLDTNPFEVVANSLTYHPGQEIYVVIYPRTENELFRGFFLQARDVHTDKWIGEWVKSDKTNVIPECSAITHGDNKDKIAAKFLWKAPQSKHGSVYFTGTVLKDYGTFWSGIIAKVPQ